MDREFEKFLGRPNEPLANRLHISVNPKGVIVFNRNLFNRLGKPEAVFLHYSRARDIIALEPASPRFNESFPLKATGSSSYYVNAAPFCRHFNIRIDSTLKFIDPEMTEGALHLNLNATVTVSRKRKKR